MGIKFKVVRHAKHIFHIAGFIEDLTYVIVGEKRAAVIDTGIGIGSLRAKVEKITELPYFIINTHGHPDHAGGNGQFADKDIYLNSNDIAVYKRMCTIDFRKEDLIRGNGDKAKSIFPKFVEGTPETKELKEGMTFDLGGRSLSVIGAFSHTPGSVCIYDTLSKGLFAGDVLTNTSTWLHLDVCGPLSMYIDAMQRIKEMELDVLKVYPGHLPSPITYDVLDKKITCAQAIYNNPKIGKPVMTFAGEGYMFKQEDTSIIYDPNHIK